MLFRSTPLYSILSVAGGTTYTIASAPGALTQLSQIRLPVAPQVDVDAGVSSTSAVSPATLRWGIRTSLSATSGYVAMPSWLGGWILQWGQYTSTSGAIDTITFPTPFISGVYQVSLTPRATTLAITDAPIAAEWGNPTLTTFQAFGKAVGNTHASSPMSFWAIGK